MRGMSPGKRLTCRYQGSNLGCEWKLAFSPTGLSSPVNHHLILIDDQPSMKLSGYYPSNESNLRVEDLGDGFSEQTHQGRTVSVEIETTDVRDKSVRDE